MPQFNAVYPQAGSIKPDEPLDWSAIREQDALGFKTAAPRLATLIAHMAPKCCFGIYGPWGTGKSTMMKCVQDILAKECNGDVATVWFDTWKFDMRTGDEICYALMKRVCDQLGGKEESKRKKRRAIFTHMAATAVAMGDALSRAVLNGPGFDDIRKTYDTVAEGLSDRRDGWADAVESTQKDYSDLVSELLDATKHKRLVVFVDDLDRCLPHNAVTVLEWLKNFLVTDRTIYILGVDRSSLADAICQHYRYSRAYGERYIDKVVTLSFELQTPSSATLLRRELSAVAAAMPGTNVENALNWSGQIEKGVIAAECAAPLSARTTRKLARKLALIVGAVLWEAAYDDNHGGTTGTMRPDFADGTPESTMAPRLVYTVALLSTLKEALPRTFGSFNSELLESLGALDGKPVTRNTSRDKSTWGRDRAMVVTEKCGLELWQAKALGEALFGPEPPTSLSQIRTLYDRLGTWL